IGDASESHEGSPANGGKRDMTSAEAKSILIGVRQIRGAGANPEFAEEFQQMERDPELREWFEAQQRFHAAVRTSLAKIPVPSDLRDRILAGPKLVTIPWWRLPAV